MTLTTFLELAMLTCFGASWPVATLRMLREGRASSRGMLPTTLTLFGYMAGMAAKIVCACSGDGLAPIFWMYLFNAGSVSLNLALQWHFAVRATPAGADRGARTVPHLLLRLLGPRLSRFPCRPVRHESLFTNANTTRRTP